MTLLQDVIAVSVGLLLMLSGGFLIKLYYIAFKSKYIDFIDNKDKISLIIAIFSQALTGGTLFAIGSFLIGLLIVFLFTLDIIRELL